MNRLFSGYQRLAMLCLFLIGGIGLSYAGIYEATLVSGQSYRIANGKKTAATLYDDPAGTVPKQKDYSSSLGDEIWWTVNALDDGGFTIRNVATGRYLKPASSKDGAASMSGTEVTCYIKKNEKVTSDNYFNITASPNSNISLNIHGGNGTIIGWDANDGGSGISPSEWGFLGRDALDSLINVNHGLVRLISGRNANSVIAEKNNGLWTESKSSKTDWGQIWILASSGNGFTVRNAESGNYVKGVPGTYQPFGTATSSDVYYIRNSTAKKGYVNISATSDYSGQKSLHHQTSNGAVVGWTADASPGSDWKIEPVADVSIDDLRAHFDEIGGYAAPKADSIYRIVSNSYGRILTESYLDHQLPNMEQSDSYSQYWRMVAKDSVNFAFQNISTKRYIQRISGGLSSYYATGTTPAYFSVERNENYIYDNLYSIAVGTTGLHCAASQSYKTVHWHCDADASQWRFQPVTITNEQLAEAEAEYKYFQQLQDKELSSKVLAFFDDAACTTLKAEYQDMSDDELKSAMDSLPAVFYDMALKVKNNSWRSWEKEFRVQNYRPFSNADYWSGRLKTNPYGRINNPTGIVLGLNEYAFIMVGDDAPSGTRLQVEIHTGYTDNWGQQTVALKKGLNVVQSIYPESYLFICYETPNGTEIVKTKEMPIHIEGGKVNGYFDIKKHSDSEWADMQRKGLFKAKIIDLLGDYAQLRIQSEGTRKYNPTKIHPLIGEYDWIAYNELSIMGLTEVPDSLKDMPGAAEAYESLYPSKFNNRMPIISGEGGDMFATSYYTNLGDAYMSSSYNYNEMKRRDGCLWAPGHEIGHMNQGAIHLAASTEVSNNFFSNVLVYLGGNTLSRTFGVTTMQEHMAADTHNWPQIVSGGYWLPTQMYFNLYLYFHALGHDPLFYQKLFRELRKNPMNNGAGNISAANDYLHFAKKACDAAELDLSDFFEYWGFFKPVSNMKAASYSTWYITATQSSINSAKLYMSRYPKANASLMFIDDYVGKRTKNIYSTDNANNRSGAVWGGYMDFLNDTVASNPTNFSYTMNTGSVTIPTNADGGAAGIKVRDADGNLIYVAVSRTFTIPENLRDKVASISVALVDGTEIPLYDSTADGVYKLNIHQGTDKAVVRYTNGDDAALLSTERDGANAIALLDSEAPAQLTQRENVVDASGNAANFVYTDAADFYTPTDFTAASMTYIRSARKGYEAVCLPFAISASDFGEGYIIEKFDSHKSEGGENVALFEKIEGTLEGGMPALLYTPEGVNGQSIVKTNVPVVATAKEIADGSIKMLGSYHSQSVGVGKYLLAPEGLTLFRVNESVPSRIWFEADGITDEIIRIEHPEIPTGIVDVLDAGDEDAPAYDLQGRPVFELRKNQIYIKNGRVRLNK